MLRRFEDIHAWQEARILVKTIYQLSDEGKFAKDYGLRDHMRRAAVSAMANIVDRFVCDSNIEFARFLGIARRSAVEVQSLLCAALDVGYIDPEHFKGHYDQAAKTKALISVFKNAIPKKR